MSRIARLFTAVTLLAALLLGTLSSARPAEATGFVCSGNVNVSVVCVNGPITVNLDKISVLNGNTVTLVDIQNSLNHINILNDISVLDIIHSNLLNIGLQVCQVKVIEIGLINLNKAFC